MVFLHNYVNKNMLSNMQSEIFKHLHIDLYFYKLFQKYKIEKRKRDY